MAGGEAEPGAAAGAVVTGVELEGEVAAAEAAVGADGVVLEGELTAAEVAVGAAGAGLGLTAGCGIIGAAVVPVDVGAEGGGAAGAVPGAVGAAAELEPAAFISAICLS